MATYRAEPRVNDKGHQELLHEGELWGTFNGRTGWVLDDDLKRHEVSSKRAWDAGVKMHGAQPQPMRPKAPSKPRARRSAEPEPIATTPTLLEAIKAHEVQLVGEPTEHNEAWIVYQHLEDTIAQFGLTLRAAEYYDIVQVVDRHLGQPRMGKALDGKWRMLKVEVLREPTRQANPVEKLYAYHATTKKALPTIRREGLVPMVQPAEHADEDRATDEPVVFFAPSEDHARVWGRTILRFPAPDEYWDDTYSDTTWVPEWGVVASAMFTDEPIPPGLIEVKEGDRWKPLLGRRKNPMQILAGATTPKSERISHIDVLPRRAPLTKTDQNKAAKAFRRWLKDPSFAFTDDYGDDKASSPIEAAYAGTGIIQGVLISTESGKARSVEPAPVALARLLTPRLNILDPDAFAKLTELEGASWASEEREHADEPGRFFDAQDAYRILKDGGLADKHDLAEVADSPGFVGAEGEIYVIAREGEILLFSDTVPDLTKVARAKRILRIVPSGLEHEGDVSWLQAGEAQPGMIVFSEASSLSAPDRSRPLEVTKVTAQSVFVVPIRARRSKPIRYVWSEYNGQYQRKTKVAKPEPRAWRKTRYETVTRHLVRERKGTKS